HEEARQGLAITLLESKGYAEAAEHLEHLRRCQPDNLRVALGLAECRFHLGDADAAAPLVDHVLAQEPNLPRAQALRGRLLAHAGDYVAAETWLRQAVAGAPSDHQARYDLILCLRSNGKDEEAQQQKQQLLQLEEDLKRFNAIVTRELIQRPKDPA